MTDRPTGPAKAKRPTIANADVPSETVTTGLPGIGEGASAAHFARDAVSLNAGEGHEDGDGARDADDSKG